jgi:hypothetical protein
MRVVNDGGYEMVWGCRWLPTIVSQRCIQDKKKKTKTSGNSLWSGLPKQREIPTEGGLSSEPSDPFVFRWRIPQLTKIITHPLN